jgi:hypothetical protein
VKPRKNDIRGSFEKNIQKSPIFTKKNAKFLRYGKNHMSMWSVNKFFGNVESSILNIIGTTRIAKTTFASKTHIFHFTTLITVIKGVPERRITTMNNFLNFIKNDWTDGETLFKKGIPMIGKYVFDFKRLLAHNITNYVIAKKIK